MSAQGSVSVPIGGVQRPIPYTPSFGVKKKLTKHRRVSRKKSKRNYKRKTSGKRKKRTKRRSSKRK